MIPEHRDHSPSPKPPTTPPSPPHSLSLATQPTHPPLNTLWQNPANNPKPTWPEAFGTSPQSDELFSAWQFATYLQKVAAAGKAEYPLPMYANAALIRPNYKTSRPIPQRPAHSPPPPENLPHRRPRPST